MIGLAVDGGRANWEIVPVEETLAISATDLERNVSRYFAGLGWTAERDDPEVKVFTAQRSSVAGPVGV